MELLHEQSIKYFTLVVNPSEIKKNTKYEISCNCPLCGDKKHRLHLYRPQGFDQDVVHCFNEGCVLSDKHHNILNFLKIAKPDLVKSYSADTFKEKINKWTGNVSSIVEKIEKTTGISEIETRKAKLELPLDKLFIKCKDSKKCTEYVKNRKIQNADKFIDDWYFSDQKFFVYNNKTLYLENYIIIPIIHSGLYKGFYSRSIQEKQFGTFLLPGAEKIWFSNSSIEDVQILTEGIFDALSTGYKKSGAMISASLSPSLLQELKIQNPNVIFALDNDKTGVKKSIQLAKEGFRVFIWPEEMQQKDFNEMIASVPIYAIKNLIQNNIHSGIDAQVRLKMKNL